MDEYFRCHAFPGVFRVERCDQMRKRPVAVFVATPEEKIIKGPYRPHQCLDCQDWREWQKIRLPKPEEIK